MGLLRLKTLVTGLLILPVITVQAETDFYQEIEPILIDYCFDCHGDGMDKGDFVLDEYDKLEEHLSDHELWFTVWENTRKHLMPPAEKRQLKLEELEKLKTWIERDVFQLDPQNPDPGRVTIRRLNREEYQNTIKDIFGYTYSANSQFPPDDTGYGFDNIGDVLSMSPLLMEKYLDAAQDIVREIVHTEGKIIPTYYINGDHFVSEDKKKGKTIPMDKPRVYKREQDCNNAGEYNFEVYYRMKGGNAPTPNKANLVVKVNGKELKTQALKYGADTTKKFSFKAPLVKGKNSLELVLKDVVPAGEGQKKLAVEIPSYRFNGPLDGSYKVYPSEYKKIFVDGPPPEEAEARRAYASKLFHYWGDRIYRRPVDEFTMKRLVAMVETGEKSGQSFEKGIAQGLTAMLASPNFLFRAEVQPEPDSPGKIVPIDEYALASRLSYFLWSSTPDAELLKLAGEKRLRKELHAQVERMLKDWKASRFVRNFTGQWLQTRDLDLVNTDPKKILGLDDKEADRYYNYRVREAMKQEVEMLFDHILDGGLPATELLTANYTFLNEDLAYTYGIDGVKGRDMRKVDLKPEDRRGGILTQGAFLTITSNPTRTSPVKRGLFVLENLLATPAPPAPEEVPTIEEQQKKGGNKQLTMRELMEIHRENSLCASCHARMDPIGLALENYNALGMWRTEEKGKPIDAGGTLMTGEDFTDSSQLSKILATARKEDFHRCLAEKLLTYSIGRGVEYYDGPTIERIVKKAEEQNGKLTSFVHAIVESAPFQMRRGDGERLALSAGE